MSAVLVLGSGFAGLWASLGAARRLDELGASPKDVSIKVVSSLPYHDIRVRNYEADLTQCRIPLQDVLDPAGVEHIAADVQAINPTSHTVTTSLGQHTYDRLVVALGSQVVKPDIPGLHEFGFDVDTYDGAIRLQRHLEKLADGDHTPAAATAVVVGAGRLGLVDVVDAPEEAAPASEHPAHDDHRLRQQQRLRLARLLQRRGAARGARIGVWSPASGPGGARGGRGGLVGFTRRHGGS